MSLTWASLRIRIRLRNDRVWSGHTSRETLSLSVYAGTDSRTGPGSTDRENDKKQYLITYDI